MFFYLDPVYIWVFFITLIISFAAQWYVSSAYKKWSQVRNSVGMTGTQVGQAIVDRTPLGDAANAPPEFQQLGRMMVNGSTIAFQRVGGVLTDHYDPRTHTVGLSDGVANEPSVAAMAIVAHELGHAEQHEQASILMTARNFLVPAVRISPQIAYVCIFIGLFLRLTALFYVGILFYGLMVLFSVITLPVEIDASRRGLRLLRDAGLVQAPEDASGSRQVLTAAATTYLAAAVTAVLQLLYFLSLAQRRR